MKSKLSNRYVSSELEFDFYIGGYEHFNNFFYVKISSLYTTNFVSWLILYIILYKKRVATDSLLRNSMAIPGIPEIFRKF